MRAAGSPSRMFRRRLRAEIDAWQADELVSPDQADTLRARYDVRELAEEATTTFVHAIFIIGAVLVGCGVIAFVAAHWEAIPVVVKVILLFSVMLAVHAVGYVFWKVRETRVVLGHALMLLGTLIFGANIGLMAQIFHVSSRPMTAFAIWSVGALVMAYGVRSVPTLVVAMVTAYVWWAGGWIPAHESAAWFFPATAGILFLPLSIRERSTVAHTLTIVAIAVSAVGLAAVEGQVTEADGTGGRAGQAAAAMAIAVGLAVWAAGDAHRMTGWRASMALILSALGLGALAVTGFVLSFHEPIGEIQLGGTPYARPWLVYFLVFLVGAVLVAVYGHRRQPAWTYLKWLSAVAYAAAAILLVATLAPVGVVAATILANVAFLGLAIAVFTGGLVELNRAMFWIGLLMLIADIAARFFEYETGLVAKSVVFIVIGAVVIYAGILFERHVQRRRA